MTDQEPTPNEHHDVDEPAPLPHDVVEAILHYDEGDQALDADRPRPDGDADADATAEPIDGEPVEEDPLAAALRERGEFLDALQRKQAEFENFRRRTREEGARLRDLGRGDVAERMLDVLDDFDRTIDAAGDGVDEGFLKGVQLVHDKLVRSLGDVGLTRIDDAGAPFDPNRHDAVQQVEGDEARDEPVVHQVLRPGYELGGRVLRAAMVVVEQ